MKKLILIIALAFNALRADAQFTVTTDAHVQFQPGSVQLVGTLCDTLLPYGYYETGFEYGQTVAMDSTSFIVTSQPTPCVNIGRWVYNIAGNTVYYYRAFAIDTIAGITVYGNTLSFTSMTSTSIKEIHFYDPMPRYVELYDFLGKLVRTDTVVGKYIMPNDLHGIYVYIAAAKDGTYQKGKIFSN